MTPTLARVLASISIACTLVAGDAARDLAPLFDAMPFEAWRVVGGAAKFELLPPANGGVGPTLGALGVTGALADPRLEVVNQATGATIAANDNWTADLTSVFSSVGAFALNPGSADAAVVATLPPGSYTAKVSGANRGTGVALVEVYELP